MADQNRRNKRIEKKISLRFCLANEYPIKWDMSTIQNISVGGVRFSAPTDLNLKDQIIRLQIEIPELAPGLLDLEAIVLDAKSRANNAKYSDIRAEFINLLDITKERLSIVERIIEGQESKNTRGDKCN